MWLIIKRCEKKMWVDLKSNGGKPAYEVKLRQGMSKKEVLIDAATGEQILQRQK